MRRDLERLESRPGIIPRDEEARALWQQYMGEASRTVADLPVAEREELLLELASHLAASIGADAPGASDVEAMRAAMMRLGRPKEFLRPMLAASLTEQGVAAYHPVLLAKGLYHSLFGGLRSLTVALAFGLGYVAVAVFGVMALFKAAFPTNIGYFVYPSGAQVFGITGDSGMARDVLGYWVIPIALLVVAALYVLLTRGLRSARARHSSVFAKLE